MNILHWKALHIVFVVTWFAGLFYIVRLFVYYAEALQRPTVESSILKDQFKLMQKRLWYGITWPSMWATMVLGGILLWSFRAYWSQGWMHVKLVFVVGLVLYHLWCGQVFHQCQQDRLRWTSNQLRIWNEVATLFLVAIVFLVVLKNTIDFLWGLLGLVVFSVVLLAAIRVYRMLRLGKKQV